MTWISSLFGGFKKRTCSHYATTTRTWFDDGLVFRETVCLHCGKRVPCPKVSDNEIRDMLERARAFKEGKE